MHVNFGPRHKKLKKRVCFFYKRDVYYKSIILGVLDMYSAILDCFRFVLGLFRAGVTPLVF